MERHIYAVSELNGLVKALLDRAYQTCETILKRDRAYLDKVAGYLLEAGLSPEEFT